MLSYDAPGVVAAANRVNIVGAAVSPQPETVVGPQHSRVGLPQVSGADEGAPQDGEIYKSL